MPVAALRFTSWFMIRLDPLGLGVTPCMDMFMMYVYALSRPCDLQSGAECFESETPEFEVSP